MLLQSRLIKANMSKSLKSASVPNKISSKDQVQNYVPYELPFWGVCFVYDQILTYLRIFWSRVPYILTFLMHMICVWQNWHTHVSFEAP